MRNQAVEALTGAQSILNPLSRFIRKLHGPQADFHNKIMGKIRAALAAPPVDRMKHLGILGLLSESSLYVPEELRQRIQEAFDDAQADGLITWRRVLHRLDIEVAAPPPGQRNES